jgi:hypothetical protein
VIWSIADQPLDRCRCKVEDAHPSCWAVRSLTSHRMRAPPWLPRFWHHDAYVDARCPRSPPMALPDQDGSYAAAADRHPGTAVIVPPRCAAVLRDDAATARARRLSLPVHRRERSHVLAESVRLQPPRQGRGGDRVMKQAIGDGQPGTRKRARSRMDECQASEVTVAVNVLNRLLELG